MSGIKVKQILINIPESSSGYSLDASGVLNIDGSLFLNDWDLSQYLWDDLRVPATATEAGGSNPPVWALIKNDGLNPSGTGNALRLLSGSQMTITKEYTFNQSFTISFWFKPEVATTFFRSILSNGNNFELSYWGSSNIAMSINGFSVSSVAVNVGTWNHIVMSIDIGGSPNFKANLYINGVNVGNIQNGGTPSNNDTPLILNEDNTVFTIEELCLYEGIAWDVSQVQYDYNSGIGISKEGNEPNLSGLWKFESSTGNIAVDDTSAGNDASISGVETTNFQWVSGHIGAANVGSRGVYTWYFPPGIDSELHFTMQLPHSYKEGTNLEPHVHWFKDSSDNGYVIWGLEYTSFAVGSPILDTSLYDSSILVPPSSNSMFHHAITELGEIDGSSLKISAMISGRIYRKGSEDTFTGNAGFLEFDCHYLKDTNGSRQMFIK